jgi:hypothetical protein
MQSPTVQIISLSYSCKLNSRARAQCLDHIAGKLEATGRARLHKCVANGFSLQTGRHGYELDDAAKAAAVEIALEAQNRCGREMGTVFFFTPLCAHNVALPEVCM